MGRERAEIAGAQVGAEALHGVIGDEVAGDHPEDRARDADDGAFRDQQHGELVRE